MAIDILILWLLFQIILGGMVWRDARRTKMSYPLLWGIAVAMFTLIAFPIFVIIQYRKHGQPYFTDAMRILSIVFFLLCLFLFGITKTEIFKQRYAEEIETTAKILAEEEYKKTHPYKIVDTEFEHDKFDRRIYTGILVAEKDLRSVYIEAKVFDDNNIVIGYTNDAVSNLRKGEKWRFKMDIDHITKKQCSVQISRVQVY